MRKLFFGLNEKVHYVFNKLGVDLVKSSANFLEADWDSPIELMYKTHNRYILLEVPIEQIRFMGVHGYNAGKGSQAPFVLTIEDYVKHNKIKYLDSKLYNFYASFQPKSIAEYLYLETAVNHSINTFSASGVFLPWQDIDPTQKIKQRALEIIHDNKEHKSILGVSSGDPFYGPVSLDKGELEYNRLVKVYRSIFKSGFKIDLKGKNNINAVVLEKENEYCYFVFSGQHRIAALSVLNYKKVALQIYKGLVVRRSEVSYWPGVTNGYFSESEALAIFDRIFLGNQ